VTGRRRPLDQPGIALLALAGLVLLAGCGGSPAPAVDHGINQTGVTVFAGSARTALPALAGPTLAGGTLTLASLRGQVVVLNVWASWCVPCKAESPALAAVARKVAARGVVFVGIDEADEAGAAKSFLAGINSDYANLSDPDGQLLADLRMLPPAIPGSLVVDRQGRVAARVIGPTTAAQMTALVDRVLAAP
jgi:thiol-disulfide isomerase/thioredoxin